MTWEIREGDALAVLRTMESDSVDCVVTSPPYWGLRDYGCASQRAPDSDAIPLCPDRHHNVRVPGFLSIHHNPIEFRARYGTEAEIRDRVSGKWPDDHYMRSSTLFCGPSGWWFNATF